MKSETNQFHNLTSPFKIGNLVVKNRFGMAAMGMPGTKDANGHITDNGIAYFTERARGDFGFITVYSVHPDDEIDPAVMPNILRDKPGFIKRAKLLLDQCHAYGAKVFIQISMGLGRNGIPGCKGPEELPYYGNPSVKTPGLTTEEIEAKIKKVVETAKFMQDTGFDGVEIHAMHWGYLLDELAMEITNHRTDKYGGSLENRLRAVREIAEGIKALCGKGYPVIMRLGLKSFMEGFNRSTLSGENEAGRTLEESIEIAKLLEQYGYDALNTDMGVYDSFYYLLPPSYMEKGYILPYVEKIKQAVSIPVIAAGGRLNDPYLCEKAVAEGMLDGIALGRQSLADPMYPRKIAMGKPEKIRPCIGCNVGCNGETTLGKNNCCAVNPLALKEGYYGVSPALKRKRIAVIGGGIAGMECARTAALRGHQVSLYEKEASLGGLLLAAGHHAFKSEIQDLNLWYQNELEELGIPVYLNREMRAEDIRALDADTIVLTVGAVPIMPPIPGIDSEKTIDCVSAAADRCSLGEKVVLVGGGMTGCEIAYDLAMKGKKVTVVDALDHLMMTATAVPNKLMMFELFKKYGIEVVTGHRIEEINETGAVVSDQNGERKTIEADQVIMNIGFRARPSMAAELYGCGKDIYSIATGVGPILVSVRDAYEIARQL